MAPKIGLKIDPVLDGVWVPKSIQNGSKIRQKICYFGGLFLDPFLVEFWGSLGASWEPSWAS